MKKMLLSLLTISVMFTTTLPISAQNKLYVHFINGECSFYDNVDSITFSISDADEFFQQIHFADISYSIPISEIDSFAVEYFPSYTSYTSCPNDNHPHMIDLGLPSGTKWACCNVGASTPEGYGGYYAWGETSEKSDYFWQNYKYWNDKDGDECVDDNELENLGADIAGTSYDVAHVRWGGSWRMPSLEQIQELFNNCTSTWETINGVNGRLCKSINNDGSIFFPVAGYREYDELVELGSCGYYWSSTQAFDLRHIGEAHRFDLDSGGACWSNGILNVGFNGLSVRPVSK